jgi:hypothetical protein
VHRDTYTIVLRVHVCFPQRTPSNKSHHGRRQVQASGDNGGICRRLFEVDNCVVYYILLQSVVELARNYFETSWNDPVCKDPVMCCQRHRDYGDKEEDDGRDQGEFEDIFVTQHVVVLESVLHRGRTL